MTLELEEAVMESKQRLRKNTHLNGESTASGLATGGVVETELL